MNALLRQALGAPLLLIVAALGLAQTALASDFLRRQGAHPSARWVFDNRHHHDHYYPSVGYSLRSLPPGYVRIRHASRSYFYLAGVWYMPAAIGFSVIIPPIGVVIPLLPPAYATLSVGGTPYYYANGVYYVAAPGGYAVAAPPTAGSYIEAPPATAVRVPPPDLPATSPPGPTWYYCESNNTYYPYTTQCPDGWQARPVPR